MRRARYQLWVPHLDPVLGTRDQRRMELARLSFPARQRHCVAIPWLGRITPNAIENQILILVPCLQAADETFSFKYSPGKLRGNQYKSMMTKEELEEEQSGFAVLSSMVLLMDEGS
ncbi:Mxra7 [Columba guinea]|nr:Mxra7 [Columba guinea]